MDNPYIFPLSLITFLPAIGALALAFFPKDNKNAMRRFTFAITAVVFVITVWMALPRPEGSTSAQFDLRTPAVAEMQDLFSVPWIKSFNIFYLMGTDGISFPLVILTSFVCMLAMGASWNIDKHVKAYCILFLLLETGMIGVFLALDFFLFYVFWEVMLLPMYFLIGVWGGPRKEYAAIKFFLYTLVGSVLMLIAILMLYFNSDLRKLSDEQLVGTGVVSASLPAEQQAEQTSAILKSPNSQHTFNILALQKIGQLPDSPFNLRIWGHTLQWWAFLLLFIGFAIKVPAVPLHTWLPDAHVEAPTPISMILAGVLLKMGGYGIIRICYPICPAGGYDLMWFVCTIGVVSMVYGAFAAMAQKDFKRLVAYSSVSHMGYVVLGLGVWSATAFAPGKPYDWSFWAWGMNGAMFQMIAHGISSAGMFFLVGVIYDRVHHRNLNEFGGLFHRMPLYTGLAIGIFFAALGLPGLVRFHWRSAGDAFRLELQPHVGRDLRRHGNFDGRVHSVDDPACLPGGRISRPARRSFAPHHAARICHRRPAVGAGDIVRRVSATAVFLHDSRNRSASGNSFGLDQNGERERAFGQRACGAGETGSRAVPRTIGGFATNGPGEGRRAHRFPRKLNREFLADPYLSIE